MKKDELTGNVNGISLPSLIAMVITSAIGAGIFALTSDLAVGGASPGPALIAWGGIVGFGILMLALSLNNLVLERPELEGIFAYAQEALVTMPVSLADGGDIGYLHGLATLPSHRDDECDWLFCARIQIRAKCDCDYLR